MVRVRTTKVVALDSEQWGLYIPPLLLLWGE
jgi:hypothetical protein